MMKSDFNVYAVTIFSKTGEEIIKEKIVSYEDEESIKSFELTEFARLNNSNPKEFKCELKKL